MTMRPRMARRRAFTTLALLAAIGVSPGSGAAGLLPPSLETRLSLGHDSNLLDASDAERAAFAAGDPGSFFVVSAMRDQFLEGEAQGEWRLPNLLAGRPSLGLQYQRRQYLHNPIRSTDRLALDGRLRPAARTRIDLSLEFQPQTYGRHRRDDNALPGEPQFRPEVRRRWDVSADLTKGLGGGADLKAGLEGSVRDYRAPFDARDRHLAGGSAGLALSVTPGLRLGLLGGYGKTWSRNEPGLPTDLSNRERTLSWWLEGRSAALAATLRVALGLGWRHYTSSDPQDDTHFGRDDRRGSVEVELTRGLPGSLASVTRLVRRWRTDLPDGDFDEDAFSDTEMQTGLRWSRDTARSKTP